MKDYILTFQFESFEEIANFIYDQKLFNDWKMKKEIKKETENRGQHVKNYHNLAREYFKEHPELTYKACLKEVIKQKKELKEKEI